MDQGGPSIQIPDVVIIGCCGAGDIPHLSSSKELSSRMNDHARTGARAAMDLLRKRRRRLKREVSHLRVLKQEQRKVYGPLSWRVPRNAVAGRRSLMLIKSRLPSTSTFFCREGCNLLRVMLSGIIFVDIRNVGSHVALTSHASFWIERSMRCVYAIRRSYNCFRPLR